MEQQNQVQKQRHMWLRGMKQKGLCRDNCFSKERPARAASLVYRGPLQQADNHSVGSRESDHGLDEAFIQQERKTAAQDHDRQSNLLADTMLGLTAQTFQGLNCSTNIKEQLCQSESEDEVIALGKSRQTKIETEVSRTNMNKLANSTHGGNLEFSASQSQVVQSTAHQKTRNRREQPTGQSRQKQESYHRAQSKSLFERYHSPAEVANAQSTAALPVIGQSEFAEQITQQKTAKPNARRAYVERVNQSVARLNQKPAKKEVLTKEKMQHASEQGDPLQVYISTAARVKALPIIQQDKARRAQQQRLEYADHSEQLAISPMIDHTPKLRHTGKLKPIKLKKSHQQSKKQKRNTYGKVRTAQDLIFCPVAQLFERGEASPTRQLCSEAKRVAQTSDGHRSPVRPQAAKELDIIIEKQRVQPSIKSIEARTRKEVALSVPLFSKDKTESLNSKLDQIGRNSNCGFKKQENQNCDNNQYNYNMAKQKRELPDPEANSKSKQASKELRKASDSKQHAMFYSDNIIDRDRNSSVAKPSQPIPSKDQIQQQNNMNLLSEQTDPEKRAMQIENFLSNINQKAKLQQGNPGAQKSRELNRHWLKMKNESNADQRNHSVSPVRQARERSEEPVQEHASVPKTPAGAEDKLICLIKTNEPHLKRAVEARSQYWVENKGKHQGAGTIYDIKFEFQDQPADYSSLKGCQLFNHFQNNTEITTKSGLCKNLYQNCNPTMEVDKWFPRCYDLSQWSQTEELLDDFMTTAMQNIIKKHYLMFKELCTHRMKQAYSSIAELKNKRDQGAAVYNFKDDKSRVYLELNKECPCPEQVLVNTKHLERAFKFCKKMLKNQYSPDNMNDFVRDEFRPHDLKHTWNHHGFKGHSSQAEAGYQQLSKMYNDKIWSELLAYSKQEFPIKDFKHLPREIRPSKKEMMMQTQGPLTYGQLSQQHAFTDGFSSWERPSLYLIYRVMKYHKAMKQYLPQYSTDGTRNIWIVKPCYNARGFGIYCIDNCLQEFQTFMKNQQSQSKIVQKYIEKPLLLNHNNEIRKFDIRQWVLVTSYDPLQIYIFDEFYLRICGSKYELSDIQDSYKHLTNYTIQKHNSKVSNKEQDLVMSQQDFFYKAFKNDKEKQTRVRQGLEEVIIKTIRTGQEAGVEHKPNSFEIYGFDFMLDQKLNPWLLEVNLSPACAERTQWLISMLDRMASGLFSLLERKVAKVTDDFKGNLKTYLIGKRQKQSEGSQVEGWKLIYDQATSANYKNLLRHSQQQAGSTLPSQVQPSQLFTPRQPENAGPVLTQVVIQNSQNPHQAHLEATGLKIQTRLERKVQQLHLQGLASRIIQRHYRGFVARKRVQKMKLELVVVFIQSFMRMCLAKMQKQRLRQLKYSVVVQKYLRKYLAKKTYFKLRSDAYDQMKLNKILLIQFYARKFIAKIRQLNKIKHQKAVIIQKHIKGRKAHAQVKQYREYIQKIRTIQRSYKSRYALKCQQAAVVQKYLKGRREVIKYRRLALVKRANQMLE